MIFLARDGRLRLGTILLIAHFVIFSVMLSGFVFLRVLDGMLIRQTENSLLAQGNIIITVYTTQYAEKYPDKATWNDHSVLATAEGQSNLRVEDDPILTSLIDRPTYGTPETRSSSLGSILETALHAVKATKCCSSYRPTKASLVDFSGVVTVSKGRSPGEIITDQEEVSSALMGRGKSVMYLDSNPPVEEINIPGLRTLVDYVVAGEKVLVSVAMPIVLENRVLGAVVMERAPRSVAYLVYSHFGKVFWAGTGLLLLVILITLFTTLTITRPVRAVVDQIRRAIEGERGAVRHLKHPISWEVDLLSKSVANLATSLEQRAEESQERADYVQKFAEFVTHEVKNALAPTFGAMEWLQENSASIPVGERENYYRKISLVERKSKEINDLVERLGVLARAEAGSIGTFDPADVKYSFDQIQERYSSDKFGVEIDLTLGVDTVAMPAETFQSIVVSLIDNAYLHGGEDANVIIKVTNTQEDVPIVHIELSDDGKGIKEENIHKIFEPFFTTARDTGSRGLGLAIVKALLEAHGGSIKLMSLGHGTSFQITLPSRLS
jgi:signal transduction histidine kinase